MNKLTELILGAVHQQKRVLLSADGPDRNVIKFKPPIVFNQENVDELVDKLDEVLTELAQ